MTPSRRAYLDRMAAAELCPDCCKPALPGHTRCASCRDKQNARYKPKGTIICSGCGQRGHNTRTCKEKLHAD